ncbi:hypothetical protein [Oceanobacillus chungangensis]|uniref:Lipoprotein n=1 Tax=Oceanobacillus chungangensis TaxID=1229152 RepID=A0A3D8PM68_9BACI|nr:hypothetical protein [Oceanobacillus chungangensis]RDW17216.1 hypothetical protein CWR45_12535 [Oceanobacillus chungangensis]
MNKIFILLFSVLIVCSACSSQNYDSLTRVDVKAVDLEGNYGETEIIIDEETIIELKGIFTQVKWEPNTEVSMARLEDVLVTLFFTLDKNEPERLYEYRVWFSDNSYAEIISDHNEEGYGTLNKEAAVKLKNILLN